MTLRTLNYGNYGIFLIMGNAGFCPSTVVSIMQGSWITYSINKNSLNTKNSQWYLVEVTTVI